VSFPPPLTISTGGGRGRGGGLFPAYHHVGFGRGRGGGFSADNNSQSSIVAQNGSINGYIKYINFIKFINFNSAIPIRAHQLMPIIQLPQQR
jgi:hypothetical protein